MRGQPAGKGGDDVTISSDLLEILACPKCKGELQLSEAENTLTCAACRLRYRIENDIPIMLIDEAQPLD